MLAGEFKQKPNVATPNAAYELPSGREGGGQQFITCSEKEGSAASCVPGMRCFGYALYTSVGFGSGTSPVLSQRIRPSS